MGKEIIIRDLIFSYAGNGNQLENVSLKVSAGEVIVMTGPSGSLQRKSQEFFKNILRLSYIKKQHHNKATNYYIAG